MSLLHVSSSTPAGWLHSNDGGGIAPVCSGHLRTRHTRTLTASSASHTMNRRTNACNGPEAPATLLWFAHSCRLWLLSYFASRFV